LKFARCRTDLEGTAAVALAALLGAMKLRDASSNLRERSWRVGKAPENLKDLGSLRDFDGQPMQDTPTII